MAVADDFRTFVRVLFQEFADKLALEHDRRLGKKNTTDAWGDDTESTHSLGLHDQAADMLPGMRRDAPVAGCSPQCDDAPKPFVEAHVAQSVTQEPSEPPSPTSPKTLTQQRNSDWSPSKPNPGPTDIVPCTPLQHPLTRPATDRSCVRDQHSDAGCLSFDPSSFVAPSPSIGASAHVQSSGKFFSASDIGPYARTQTRTQTTPMPRQSSLCSRNSLAGLCVDLRSRMSRVTRSSVASSLQSSPSRLGFNSNLRTTVHSGNARDVPELTSDVSMRSTPCTPVLEGDATEDSEGDMVFEAFDVWKAEDITSIHSSTQKLHRSPAKKLTVTPANFKLDDHSDGVSWLVLLPNSLYRILWDLVSMVVALHDTIASPMHFVSSFQMPVAAAWIARVFWTFDIPVSFITAYPLQDGSNEIRLSKIARHYAKKWLLFDTLLVLVDWIEVLVFSKDDALSLLQVFRMVRLLRVARLYAVLNTIVEHYSDKVELAISAARNICGISLVVHVVACCWIGLGSRQTGWVAHYSIAEDDGWRQYASAYHWALSQFYGSVDISPTNVSERFFAIGVLMLGFVLATVFVSNITSSMTRFHIITSGQSMQLKVLRRYLRDRNISHKLVARVRLNAQHALKQQERSIPEDDVELLKIVSKPLIIDLHLEIYSPIVCTHPLFLRMMKEEMVMSRICDTGVSMQTFSPDDVLFRPGELPICPNMLFVLEGQLSYSSDMDNFDQVFPEKWVCEHVLWTSWVYHGLLYALVASKLAFLNAEVFLEIIQKTHCIQRELGRYAEAFVKALNEEDTRSDLGLSMDVNVFVNFAFPNLAEQEERKGRASQAYGIIGNPWMTRRLTRPRVDPVTDFNGITASEGN